MTKDDQKTPKLFVSYSWTTPEHEEWVIELASQLVENGVEVVLDKWDLREGDNAYSFMERMVTDPSIDKVLIVSDEAYAAKANNRAGGVGTETTIISAEVYGSQKQSRFVVVIPPGSSDAAHHVPAYYKGRIHIDLSNPDIRGAQFEQLVRWIFGKPTHVRPELGAPPAYLTERPETSLGTGGRLASALESLKGGRTNAAAMVADYLDTFVSGLTRFHVPQDSTGQDAVQEILDGIERLEPARNEYLRIAQTAARSLPPDAFGPVFRRFLEKLLPLTDAQGNRPSWMVDHLRFFISEVFLITISSLVDEERFSAAKSIVNSRYFLPHKSDRGESSGGFLEFRGYLDSTDALNRKLNKASARALLLKDRAERAGQRVESIAQTELILFLKAAFTEPYYTWWPDSMIYTNRYRALEVFSRCESKDYCESLLPIMGCNTVEGFRLKMEEVLQNRDLQLRFGFERPDLRVSCGLSALASLP
ncbi:TIR domain-containing protein [Pseudoxanthomonas mexicana]|uniref:TIR domain-containing protein n=1 Tax=Pseudoxanthomonas mexicana TaxID=128785 RepID=A0A7G9TAU9_PSEMX|nr:SEFIR domain-containing protein [Pseudoxanthomonas mexicana]QNN77224.1 TIR domain-containing protein [Pseudoxanthomonas mexicana]